ncbi:hypothetical protein ACU4GD_43425 [Cupriavidus basilensis]
MAAVGNSAAHVKAPARQLHPGPRCSTPSTVTGKVARALATVLRNQLAALDGGARHRPTGTTVRPRRRRQAGRKPLYRLFAKDAKPGDRMGDGPCRGPRSGGGQPDGMDGFVRWPVLECRLGGATPVCARPWMRHRPTPNGHAGTRAALPLACWLRAGACGREICCPGCADHDAPAAHQCVPACRATADLVTFTDTLPMSVRRMPESPCALTYAVR